MSNLNGRDKLQFNITKEQVESAGNVLNDTRESLATRFRALFLLRNIKDDFSVTSITKCFGDSSALLKHELAYCLGQMQNPYAIPFLIQVLEDRQQEPMVRHEAAEALVAIGDTQEKKYGVEQILLRYTDDPVKEVAETCQLALHMIRWKCLENTTANLNQSIYNSIDPAPPADTSNMTLDMLQDLLLDSKKTLWERYRALFALRNINKDYATKIIAKGLFCEDSALFRHEVAYVLGQIQSPVAIPELEARLKMQNENGMVRHECAEALGSIGTKESQNFLKEYLSDNERVVRESCEIALDIAGLNENDT